MAQVSLAWSLARVTAPVIGSTSIKNLKDIISKCNGYVWGDGTNILRLCRWYRYHIDSRGAPIFRGALQGTLSDGALNRKDSDCEKEVVKIIGVSFLNVFVPQRMRGGSRQKLETTHTGAWNRGKPGPGGEAVGSDGNARSAHLSEEGGND